jgi:hypothetical protein
LPADSRAPELFASDPVRAHGPDSGDGHTPTVA